MNTVATLLGLLDIILAIITAAISVPLVKRKIPKNYIYGVRIYKAFESDENWYAINAYAGRQLIVWSVPTLILGVVTLFLPLADHQYLFAVPFLAVFFLLVPMVSVVRYSRNL